ncbi:hypothetical protein HX793_09385 [Pseudomonas reactans]|uniref:hypothetical protein n=1 Tax=Pseudomonas reactans TaxID=117680 RepID=UPI0015A03059|nr:hypothetical protein [Pseudomonas reactans]NWC88684.1 hypothetical protein [Pseudomonas reactans]NWD29982.1 hypothetical protein [Pseudomonas reactans]NWF12213.1 hypothetical protein [Pseudomonas reactans]
MLTVTEGRRVAPQYGSTQSSSNSATLNALAVPVPEDRLGEYERSDAPRQRSGHLMQVKLSHSSPRQKRETLTADAERRRADFPAPADAKKADASLQKTLTHWLITGQLKANPVPAHSSIKPFTDAFRDAVHEPSVQAWFKSKGLDVSTVRVFSDGVVGTVMVDGVKIARRFTTTDGSGWWEVGAKVTEAVKTLSPDDFGVLLPDPQTGAFFHADVILGFYGVKVPNDPRDRKLFGERLKNNGWPTITDEKRLQWGQQFRRSLQKNDDIEFRSQMASQLLALAKDKDPEGALDLSDVRANVHPESTLVQKSQVPRERFAEWLARPAFKTFMEKVELAANDNVYRIINGTLELQQPGNCWINLQVFLDDEQSEIWTDVNPDEQSKLRGDYHQLVEMSKGTGSVLYSTPVYDMRQFLVFSGLGAPNTIAQVNSAIGWLTCKLPPMPIGGDYARLSPYAWSPGALSTEDLAVLKSVSTGAGSVAQLLRSYTFVEGFPDDHSFRLQTFFDSPNAIAKAEALARLLNMAEVADGKPLSRDIRHQLLAAAIKASLKDEMPGKPGWIAGYHIYKPSNFGRTLDEVRSEIEVDLRIKGADAKTAPLIAHMVLAQAAPEFLVKPDPNVSAEAPEALKLLPGKVRIGSTPWMNLRLACAMAEKLGGAGSSRSLNLSQALALTRLNPVMAEQEQLFKTLGAQPVLDWAVLSGVIPKRDDGAYSAQNYSTATQAFAEREASIGNAFNSLIVEPPNQTSLLIEQLAVLFPEMTKEEIRTFRLQQHQVGSVSDGPGPLLTDVILHQQTPEPVLNTLLFPVVSWLNNLVSYTFSHGNVSQETFNERIKRLPTISSLVAPAVDNYLAEARKAQEAVIKLMIVNAPLDVRRILEVADIQVLSLREATGQTLLDDSYDPTSVAEKVGRGGVLIRYDTRVTSPTGGYFEFFPATMKIVKRDDLRENLTIGGAVTEKRVISRLDSYRTALPESFDFQAYKTGDEPRTTIKSDVIIEKAGPALPGLGLVSWPAPASDYVPDSWASAKTEAIANAILNVTFDAKREQLIEHAKEPTPFQAIRSFPFGSHKVFSRISLRTVLSMLPFVGAIADISEGKVGAGVQGLLIDFASFVVTGGIASARSFFKGLKAIVPFSNRAFTMRELQGAVPFIRSLFNPLDGALDVLRAAQRGLAGQFCSIGPGLYMTATALERVRWGLGAYGQMGANLDTEPYPGSRLGVSQNRMLYAVQEGGEWFAIDPVTRTPTGTPLRDFKAEASVD